MECPLNMLQEMKVQITNLTGQTINSIHPTANHSINRYSVSLQWHTTTKDLPTPLRLTSLINNTPLTMVNPIICTRNGRGAKTMPLQDFLCMKLRPMIMKGMAIVIEKEIVLGKVSRLGHEEIIQKKGFIHIKGRNIVQVTMVRLISDKCIQCLVNHVIYFPQVILL